MSNYNEGGTACVLIRDGKIVGSEDDIGSDPFSAQAAWAPDGSLFVTCSTGGSGLRWYDRNGLAALKLPDSALLAPSSWPSTPFTTAKWHHFTGVGCAANVLWISDRTDYGQNEGGRVWLFDATRKTPIGHFALPRPGRIAVLRDGRSAWILSERRLVCVDDTGKIRETASLPSGCVVSGFALDLQDRLIVADRGATPRVLVFGKSGHITVWGRDSLAFRNKTSQRKPTLPGRFVSRASRQAADDPQNVAVDDSQAGEYTPRTYDAPIGVGVDKAGNLYVLSAGGVFPQIGRLDWYSAASHWRTPLGRVWGSAFADIYVPDPTDPDRLYNSAAEVTMDWTKPGMGQEQKLVATTIDIRKNPEDPRYNLGASGSAATSTLGVRVLGGHKFLYAGVGLDVEVYRMNASGHIAQCVSFFYARGLVEARATPHWPPNAPSGDRGGVMSNNFWNDDNGDGNWDAAEYDYKYGGFETLAPNSEFSEMTVDNQGVIWCGSAHTRREKLLGAIFSVTPKINSFGNPSYHWSSVARHPIPQASHFSYIAFTNVTPEGDLVIVGRRDGDVNHSISFWPKWTANPMDIPPAWVSRDVATYYRGEPWRIKENGVGGATAAGDYVFLGDVKETIVRVYRRKDGVCIGQLRMPSHLQTSGTLDDLHCLCAWVAPNGKEYRVTVGDFNNNRNVLYRWTPAP